MKDGGVLKIADFGWSIRTKKTTRQTVCGTLDYMCPEIVRKTRYDHRSDLWCVGILTYELLTGKAPFEAKTEKMTQKRIKGAKIVFPSYLSRVARDFVKSFLYKNPGDRMSLEEAEAHPFILSNCV